MILIQMLRCLMNSSHFQINCSDPAKGNTDNQMGAVDTVPILIQLQVIKLINCLKEGAEIPSTSTAIAEGYLEVKNVLG